jgi:hypothetical protein
MVKHLIGWDFIPDQQSANSNSDKSVHVNVNVHVHVHGNSDRADRCVTYCKNTA